MATHVEDTSSSRRLNLGCGSFRKPGYLNVDADARAQPDVIHDLDQTPYPFEDQQFAVIEADHVLEHLKDPFMVMEELHRLLKEGGRLVIRVPHFSRGFTHADHKRGFDASFPYYFNPIFKGGYTGVPFTHIRTRLRWFAQPYLKKTLLPMPIYWLGYIMGGAIDLLANISVYMCSRCWCFLVGGFEEIEFHFTKCDAGTSRKET